MGSAITSGTRISWAWLSVGSDMYIKISARKIFTFMGVKLVFCSKDFKSLEDCIYLALALKALCDLKPTFGFVTQSYTENFHRGTQRNDSMYV